MGMGIHLDVCGYLSPRVLIHISCFHDNMQLPLPLLLYVGQWKLYMTSVSPISPPDGAAVPLHTPLQTSQLYATFLQTATEFIWPESYSLLFYNIYILSRNSEK